MGSTIRLASVLTIAPDGGNGVCVGASVAGTLVGTGVRVGPNVFAGAGSSKVCEAQCLRLSAEFVANFAPEKSGIFAQQACGIKATPPE